MKMRKSGVLSILLAFIMSFAMVMPSVTMQVLAADPGGSSEGTVGYYHPTQGDVKYVFNAAEKSNIPDPKAAWLGGVEPDQGKQYVYCINPTKNALDKEKWNQHFRWRYNLNVNRWLLDNNKNQLTNPDIGKGSEAYDDLKKILFVGYPYNKGAGMEGEYDYHDTQNAVEALIAGTTSKQNELYNEALAYSGDISGNVYIYAPDTDNKQDAQNTVGLALWNYPGETPEEQIPEEPEPTSPTASVGVSAKKNVSGDWKASSEWANHQFAFKLEGAGKDEALLDGVSEADAENGIKYVHTRWLGDDAVSGTNDEVYFGEIVFNKAGTYNFKVYELDPNIKDASQPNAAVDGRSRPLKDYAAVDGMTYDHAYFDLEFVVTKAGDSLVVKQNGRDVTGKTVSVDKNGADIKFTNIYKEKGTLKTTVTAKGESGAENSPAAINVPAGGEIMDVTDKVDYSGLIAGATYTVSGELWEVKDGKTVGDKPVATATEEKKADKADGTWEIVFKNVKLEPGKSYVVFETAKLIKDADGADVQDGEVIEHNNPEDSAQTIVVSEEEITLSTQVKNQNISPAVDQTIIDIVSIKGLEKGKTYTLKGEVRLKDGSEDGAPIDYECENITVSSEDTNPEMYFTKVDASSLKAGDQIVVFEYLYEGDVEETGGVHTGRRK